MKTETEVVKGVLFRIVAGEILKTSPEHREHGKVRCIFFVRKEVTVYNIEKVKERMSELSPGIMFNDWDLRT